MSDPSVREIAERDIPALFSIRTATHENRLTADELTALSITEESVRSRLAGSFAGWVCEADQRVVGFAMVDRATGELWVIAVLPDYIGRGIGSALLRRAERELSRSEHTRIWLTTDIDPRLKAHAFYLQHGWRDERIEDGARHMVKDLADAAGPPSGKTAG